MDSCSQSIAFVRLEDLHNCLVPISQDSDIQVVGVKNRLDPVCNAESAAEITAAYRDVALDLQTVSPGSAEVGVGAHICEVL